MEACSSPSSRSSTGGPAKPPEPPASRYAPGSISPKPGGSHVPFGIIAGIVLPLRALLASGAARSTRRWSVTGLARPGVSGDQTAAFAKRDRPQLDRPSSSNHRVRAFSRIPPRHRLGPGPIGRARRIAPPRPPVPSAIQPLELVKDLSSRHQRVVEVEQAVALVVDVAHREAPVCAHAVNV
jgi:hypothetical protein